MCQLCDRPDLTMADHVEHVRALVAVDRFAVQSVQGSRTSAECSYTVGLTEQGLPELVVLAVRPTEAHRLLRAWGDYLLDDSLVLAGEALTWGPWTMEAVEVAQPAEHLVLASVLYGDRVRALQLAWCDSAGKWPWQPGHRARRAGQPLLGERAPCWCDEHRPDRLDVPPHV